MRAKMRVSSIQENKDKDNNKIQERLMFDAVYSSDPTSENAQWSKYTPYAHMEMVVDNPGAWNHFTVGQEVFVDFTPVPAPVA
jgi:hypothetical protein